jgi:hypothetical protein
VGRLFVQPLFNRVRTGQKGALPQKQQAFCLRKISDLQSVEVHTRRQCQCVEGDFVVARLDLAVDEQGALYAQAFAR